MASKTIPLKTAVVNALADAEQSFTDKANADGSVERNGTTAWEQVTHREDVLSRNNSDTVLIPYHAVTKATLQSSATSQEIPDDSFCVPAEDGPDIEGVVIFEGDVTFEHSGEMYTWADTDSPWPDDSNGDPISPDTINVYYDGVKYVAPKFGSGKYGDPNFETCPIGVTAARDEQGHTVSMMMPDVEQAETHNVIISGDFPS